MKRQRKGALLLLVEWATAPENKPTVYRAAVLLMTAVSGLFAGGFIHDLRGKMPVTREQMDSAMTQVADAGSLASALAVSTALRRYDDSLKAVARTMTDSVAVPMINTLNDLVRRVERIERGVGMANSKLDNAPVPDNATLHELRAELSELARRPTDDNEEVLQMLRELKARTAAIEERMNRKKSPLF